MNQQKRWQPEAAKEAAKQEAERLVFRDETTIDEPRSTRQSPSGEDAIVEVDPRFIKEKHVYFTNSNNTKYSEFADEVAADESSNYIFPETHTTTTNTTISIEDHIPAAGEAHLNPAELGLLFGQEGVVSSKTFL